MYEALELVCHANHLKRLVYAALRLEYAATSVCGLKRLVYVALSDYIYTYVCVYILTREGEKEPHCLRLTVEAERGRR